MLFFVTGGSGGVGAAVVQAAAQAGYDVAFTYHTNEASAQTTVEAARRFAPDQHVRAFQLDVRDSAAVDAVGEQVLDTMGDVQVVVNSAGIVRAAVAASMTDAAWHDVIDVHLTGAFYVCRCFLPTMLATGFGRIINISSVVAGGMSGMANYAAAKAGLHGLTRTLAKEVGRKNITANCIVAGPLDDGLSQQHLADEVLQLRTAYAPTPGGRLGDVTRLAQTVLFLASEAAADINGTEIVVSGGLDWLP